MLNDPIFRIALGVSLSLHFAAVSWGSFSLPKPLDKEAEKIEITYLKFELPEDASLENIPREYDIEKKELKTKSAENEQKTTSESHETTPTENYLKTEELDRLEEYIQYYELLRERIKQSVAVNYSSEKEAGSVDVIFTLKRNGRLERIALSDACVASGSLRRIAEKSIKNAAPFPPFPEKLESENLTFSIAIIFTQK